MLGGLATTIFTEVGFIHRGTSPTSSYRIFVSCHASVDKFANTLRPFAAIAAGLGPTWWSDKHNKHHALTNEMGVDEDIATDPFLFTWAPDPKYDSPLRKIQRKILFSLYTVRFR